MLEHPVFKGKPSGNMFSGNRLKLKKFVFAFLLAILPSRFTQARADDLEALSVVNAAQQQSIQILVPRTSISASELGLLVNDNDPQSVAVASYYASARDIPSANIVHLNFATGSFSMSDTDFNILKAQVDASLPSNVQALAISWTAPYIVGQGMSITSAFALGYNSHYANWCGSSCCATTAVNYFNSTTTKPKTDLNIRPAMMLGGYNTDEVKSLIDRGVTASQTFPTGKGYFIRTTDAIRSVRSGDFSSTVTNWNRSDGLQMNYIDNGSGTGLNYIQNISGVLFYLTGLSSVPQIYTNQYVPGAVADHLTSYGGKLLSSSQMSSLEWLKAGATGSYGTVEEPCNYTYKFPQASILVQNYFAGATLLESYWKSVYWPGEGIFIGDPLARPYGTYGQYVGNDLQIYTTILKPGTSYTLYSADAPQGPFTKVQQNISVAKYTFTTLIVPNASKAVYELVPSTTVLPLATPTATPTITPTNTSTPIHTATAVPTSTPTPTPVAPPPSQSTPTPAPTPQATNTPKSGGKENDKSHSIKGRLDSSSRIARRSGLNLVSGKWRIFDSSKKLIASKKIGALGPFRIDNVPSGKYTIQPVMKGYRVVPRRRTVTVGESTVSGIRFLVSR